MGAKVVISEWNPIKNKKIIWMLADLSLFLQTKIQQLLK
jgi:hypothetical protein